MRHFAATARPIAEDLAATLVFYVLFLVTRSALLAAGVGLLLGIAQVLRHRFKGDAVPPLLITGLALTVLLGGLTILTHDLRLIMLKPSIIYVCLGITMLPRGWAGRYLPRIAHGLLPARTIDRIGWAWAGLMFATAVMNLLLLATLAPVRAAAAFALWAAMSKLALFVGQYAFLRPIAGRAHAARATLEQTAPLP